MERGESVRRCAIFERAVRVSMVVRKWCNGVSELLTVLAVCGGLLLHDMHCLLHWSMVGFFGNV